MSDRLISIVLPVHNQGDHIDKIIEGYEKELMKLPFPHELVLVLNACTDNSGEIAGTLCKKNAAVRTITIAGKGWGAAVKAGLKEAGGDILCYTNCARTAPEDLRFLLAYALNNPDAVIKATRKNRESSLRQIGSVIYNLEARFLFDLYTWDINATPKIFPRKYEKLLAMQQDGDLIDAEFNIICHDRGYPILEIPVFSSKRHGGRSTTNLLSAVRMYYGIYKLLRKKARPHK